MRQIFVILIVGLVGFGDANATGVFSAVASERINLTLNCEGEINIWAEQQFVGQDTKFQTTIEIRDNVLIDRNNVELDVSNTGISKIIGPKDAVEFIFDLNRMTGALMYHMTPKYTGTKHTLQITGICTKASKLF